MPLYAAAQVGDLPFYTMPLIEGESLRARIARDGELPVADAVRLLRDVVDALACAHEHGVVHRDIKPENILISRNHAVVTDFGVAKALEVSGQASITSTGMALGTPAYMAPEQAAGDPHTDHRADLYAVGVLAYEMLTGRPPFTGPTAQSILAAQVTQAPTPISASRASIPSALAAVVMRCLEKRPADRWQSAPELLQALESSVTPSGGMNATTATGVTSGAAPAAGLSSRRPRVALLVSAILLVLLALWGVYRSQRSLGPAHGGARRVVVLPFENLGDTSRQYFANGVTEAITTQLTGLGGLSVIPRSTAFRYRGTQKSLADIGHELGVSYVLEGTVQWEEARDGTRRVRVSPELIRISDTSSIWAHSYDAVLASVFQVYSDVATEVARSLTVALDDPERRALAVRPTRSPEAYDLYLRAVEYINRGISAENLHNAIPMLDRAVALDSNFALAWGRLSETLALAHWLYVDRSDATMARATLAAERAIAIAPDLPEAHRALGNLYYRKREYDKALAELAIAQKSQPNNVDLIATVGYVERRQGRWEECLQQFRKFAQLDPGAPRVYYDLGETLLIMRRYDDAAAALARGIETAPDEPDSYNQLTLTELGRTGDIKAAQEILRKALGKMGAIRLSNTFRPPAYLIAPDEALRRSFLAVSLSDVGSDTAGYYFFRGELRGLSGEPRLAAALYDSARVILESKVRQLPDDYGFHTRLGFAYARLGRYAEAIREGKRGVELLPPTRDAYFGMNNVIDLARIYAAATQADSAVALLSQALAVPSAISVTLLRVDPAWAPIRNDPGLQRLLH